MKDEILNLKNQALGRITDAESLGELEEIRIDYLGRNGELNKFLKAMKTLSLHEKKEVGFVVNEAKKTIEEFLGNEKIKFKEIKEKQQDLTIPGIKPKIGHSHPTSIVITEMFEIFKHLGFSIMEGPEIESDIYNFEKLNLPKDHPARSLQDVLYIEEPDILLRSHTSSVETRVLENIKPPFRIVIAGKCYRFENVNASNNAMFYQFQGVSLQKGLSMADLKGTLYYFAKAFFGEERELRFRCKYYPEVEPGAGLDVSCPFCNQKGCTVCKYRGWLEMLGCGMIHPNILRNFGYDPKKISGFAFGMGLDRIVMDRFNIKDIRSLYNGDIKL